MWVPTAAATAAIIVCMAALPIPHSCCTHVGPPLLLLLSSLAWLYHLPHIAVIPMWVPTAAADAIILCHKGFTYPA